MKFDYDIDFVITWVDGNDSEWQEEKLKYLPKRNLYGNDKNFRYRDWDNLQYWFRAVEKFTPWVRKIHFVTYGHLPKWLNIYNPKLAVVKHSDFIPAKYLPTFSPRPIELNIHRIHDLADRFVYFNDDMFIIKPMLKTDFFYKGLPTDFCISSKLHSPTKGDFTAYAKINNLCLLNSNFDKNKQMHNFFLKWMSPIYGINALRNLIFYGQHHFNGFANNHLSFSYTRKTFEDVWRKEEEILDETCKNKFRSKMDVNQWLMRYWQLATGNFAPCPRSYKGKVFEVRGGIEDNYDLYYAIENQKYRIVCINDNSDIDFRGISEHVKKSFEKILPDKSSFEL
ncbi:MAG: hypothetical protein GX451_01255 [Acholeplasmataceae bacterium]|nr:hypothetical protein [Acholeplasmataceae bacterium]